MKESDELLGKTIGNNVFLIEEQKCGMTFLLIPNRHLNGFKQFMYDSVLVFLSFIINFVNLY